MSTTDLELMVILDSESKVILVGGGDVELPVGGGGGVEGFPRYCGRSLKCITYGDCSVQNKDRFCIRIRRN